MVVWRSFVAPDYMQAAASAFRSCCKIGLSKHTYRTVAKVAIVMLGVRRTGCGSHSFALLCVRCNTFSCANMPAFWFAVIPHGALTHCYWVACQDTRHHSRAQQLLIRDMPYAMHPLAPCACRAVPCRSSRGDHLLYSHALARRLPYTACLCAVLAPLCPLHGLRALLCLCPLSFPRVPTHQLRRCPLCGSPSLATLIPATLLS